jgi:hypothetical protein
MKPTEQEDRTIQPSPLRGWLRIPIAVAVVLALLIPLLPAPAHAAEKFKGYPERAASDCAASAEKAGFAIGAQPVEDLKEQQEYFHTKLAPKGFVPVFVVMRNESADDSFLFDKTRVTYGSVDSTVATPLVRSKTGEGVAIASLAAGSMVGAIVAMKLISNASQVQQNILKNEVQSKTLSPTATTHGFLYVPVPKGVARQKIRLRVPVTRAGTDETFVLDLVI